MKEIKNSKRKPLIHLLIAENNEYFVRYKAKNGNILTSSETIKTKDSAKKNILAMSGLFRVDSTDPIRVMDYTVSPPKEIVL